MKNLYDTILFYEASDAAQQEVLRAALEADPVLAEAFARWQQLQAEIRRSLRVQLPERSLLVLYALAEEQAGVLSPRERQVLAEARPRLERALAAHPALRDIVRRIQADRAAFEQVWQEHTGEAAPSPRRPARETLPRPARRSSGLRWTWRTAAAGAVLAFALISILVLQRDRGLVTIRTAEGEVRVVELIDGSAIRLMGSSLLSYAPPGAATVSHRRARLEGRAYFNITGHEQPFMVETPTALATVLGTSFGIQADEAVTEVVLTAGKVALAPRASQGSLIVLEPGQMSRVAEGALPSTPVPVDLTEALNWTGMFIFRLTPIEEIAARLARHYETEVAVAPGLEGQQVTGSFEYNQPVEQILQTLAVTLGATVHPDPAGGFLLTPGTP